MHSRKIQEGITKFLLRNEVLQTWSGYTLRQRCIMLREQKGIDINLSTLYDFYKKHGVNYYKCSTTYAPKHPAKYDENRRKFALKLSSMIIKGAAVLYFDESSFNAWLRRDHTWSHAKHPVKMVVNRTRGKGITILGTIGSVMSRPVLMQAAATSREELLKYIPLIRPACPTVVGALNLVLDNHSVHHSKNVASLFRLHNIVLHFTPPYSPEFNSIESLWSFLKERVRKSLNAERDVNMT
jgi:hypothetical protein